GGANDWMNTATSSILRWPRGPRWTVSVRPPSSKPRAISTTALSNSALPVVGDGHRGPRPQRPRSLDLYDRGEVRLFSFFTPLRDFVDYRIQGVPPFLSSSFYPL